MKTSPHAAMSRTVHAPSGRARMRARNCKNERPAIIVGDGGSASQLLQRPHGLGAQPCRTGAGLPEHRDGRCDRAARGHDPGTAVGQLALVVFLRLAVEHEAVDLDRRRRDLRRSAPLGQRGSDDLLLPRRRPGGKARARRGRVARASSPCDPGRGSTRRDDRPNRDLPRLQRRRFGRARLGRRDVDRHGLRPGSTGAAHPCRRHASACLPADARGRRRPVRADGDHNRLHRPHLKARVGRRDRSVRAADRPALRCRLGGAS